VLTPTEAVELLRTRLERLSVLQDEVRASIDRTLAGGVHPPFQIEEDYRLALLVAESTFVERLIEQITDPEHGWAPLWASFHDA
jgi:hypothetical protein